MAHASFRAEFQNSADTDFDLEIDEFQRALGPDDPVELHQSPILVLSRYSALIETVRKAAPRGLPVVQAPDLEHAAEKMPSLKPGVLVVDTASTSDVAAMVTQLTSQFTELVVIVAGQREDSAALMRLNVSAQIFRFLPVPLSHGQTRIMIEAAIAQHKQLIAKRKQLAAPAPQPEERRAPRKRENKAGINDYLVAGGVGAGLAVVLAGIWWFTSRTPSKPEAPVAKAPTTTIAVPTKNNAVASRPDPVELALARAQDAFARGEYVEPAGASALDYYRSVLDIDPNSAAAREGLRRIAGDILERGESALIAEKIEDAVKAVETARSIDPEHPRLGFLDALVARESFKLAQAQGTSRTTVAPITPLPPIEDTQELTSQDRIDPPPVAQPPAKPRAADPAVAQLPIKPLLKTPPTPVAKPTPAKDVGKEMVADVRRLLSEGKLIDPPGDNAIEALAALRAKDPARTELNELATALSGRLLESGKEALAGKAFDRSQQLLSAARGVGAGNEDAISQIERELNGARSSKSVAADTIVPASSLRVLKMVEPVYPAAARRRNEKGSVEVLFTVTPDGGVDNIEVRKSNPALVFDDAAKKALAQWQFEPVLVDGRAVPQRAVVRLQFAMD